MIPLFPTLEDQILSLIYDDVQPGISFRGEFE